MIDNKYKVLAIAIVGFVVLSIPINHWIRSANESHEKAVEQQPLQQELANQQEEPKVNDVTLTPQDPHRFAITVQKENALPRTQSQSDASMKKILSRSKTLSYMDDENAFESMRMSPQEYQNHLDEISGRIKAYEDLKNSNSSDPEIDKKLEMLYRLKSTLVVLKNKIIIPAKK